MAICCGNALTGAVVRAGMDAELLGCETFNRELNVLEFIERRSSALTCFRVHGLCFNDDEIVVLACRAVVMRGVCV